MPPRFAYWTILIDDKPTAFRAREQQELLPTLTQLRRTNERVELKWFAQGRLWESPEAQHAAGRRPKFTGEKRGGDWRPGGQHKDPRARFDKEARRRQKREQRAEWNAAPERDPNPRDRPPAGGPPPRRPARAAAQTAQRGAVGEAQRTPRRARVPAQTPPQGGAPPGPQAAAPGGGPLAQPAGARRPGALVQQTTSRRTAALVEQTAAR